MGLIIDSFCYLCKCVPGNLQAPADEVQACVTAARSAVLRHARSELVMLPPFSASETRCLVAAVLGEEDIQEDLAAMIFDKTGGLPLYIEQVM